jgi:hypothetical protein
MNPPAAYRNGPAGEGFTLAFVAAANYDHAHVWAWF